MNICVLNFCFQPAIFKTICKFYSKSTTVPHCAVLGSFFLKETDWTKLEEEEVTSLPSTREQSSLYDGLIWLWWFAGNTQGCYQTTAYYDTSQPLVTHFNEKLFST